MSNCVRHRGIAKNHLLLNSKDNKLILIILKYLNLRIILE